MFANPMKTKNGIEQRYEVFSIHLPLHCLLHLLIHSMNVWCIVQTLN